MEVHTIFEPPLRASVAAISGPHLLSGLDKTNTLIRGTAAAANHHHHHYPILLEGRTEGGLVEGRIS